MKLFYFFFVALMILPVAPAFAEETTDAALEDGAAPPAEAPALPDEIGEFNQEGANETGEANQQGEAGQANQEGESAGANQAGEAAQANQEGAAE